VVPTFFIAGDPGIPAGRAHDPFAGLPSAMIERVRAYLDAPLDEAKAVGTAPGVSYGHVGQRDLAIQQRGHFAGTTRFHLRSAATNTARDFAPVEEQARKDIGRLLDQWLRGRVSYDDIQLQSARAWRGVYEQLRDLGRKASGLDRLAPGEHHVTHDEETWFRDAVREELRYWHVFLEDVNDGRTVGDRVWQRFDAYVKALRFMYDASRTLAIPEHNTLIYWMGPKKDDPTICSGCLYMIERSPFPKEVMPAVPRDGSTRCLTNCRHKIMVRVVGLEEDVRKRKDALPSRAVMVRELRRLKEEAHGGDHHRRVRRGAELARTIHPHAANPFKGHPMPPKTRRGR
jgi:hypothetical protein